MSKLYIKRKDGQIPNDLLNRPDISFKAKGIWAYLQSKPDGWSFSVDRIASQAQEGKTAVSAGLRELQNEGYLIREPSQKNAAGQWTGYDYNLQASLPRPDVL